MFFPSKMMNTEGGGAVDTSLEDFLLGNTKNITIPSSMRSVTKYLLYGKSNIEKVVLHDQARKLEESCFEKCNNLTTIEGLEYVINFGTRSLANTGFEEFTFPDGNILLGQYILNGCNSLKKVVMSSGVAEIPAYLCYQCSALEEFIAPEGIESIESNALAYTGKLRSVSLPSTLQVINGYAFLYSGLQELVIPASCQKIYQYAFSFCKVESVTFEDPTGWFIASSINATTGDSIDLSDPVQNAVYLKETYRNKHFIKASS